jgi:hypothetical protein
MASGHAEPADSNRVLIEEFVMLTAVKAMALAGS